jgi:Spy/CpxP family protein refolding chaperone
MNKSRALRIVLYAALIFLAGAITGALVAPMVGRHFMRLPDPHQFSRLMLSHLRSGLDLTAGQEEKIKPLVEKTCADMEAIHHETMQRVVDRLNLTSEKISAFLTPEQKVKLKKMEAEHRLHLRHFHHPGVPPGPPPP